MVLEFLVDLKQGPRLKLNTPVMRPVGKWCMEMPQAWVILPNRPWVIETWPLAFLSRVRSLRKPRPVPRLGQSLDMVTRWFSVECIRVRVRRNLVSPLGARLLVDKPTEAVPVWVLAILAKARALRVVQFPIAPIKPGTRLVWCRHRALMPVYVAPMFLLPPMNLPHAVQKKTIMRVVILT